MYVRPYVLLEDVRSRRGGLVGEYRLRWRSSKRLMGLMMMMVMVMGLEVEMMRAGGLLNEAVGLESWWLVGSRSHWKENSRLMKSL